MWAKTVMPGTSCAESTLTAVAIMQLRDRGRLTLDDQVTRYVPELRAVHSEYGSIDKITIRMLLSHSAAQRGDQPSVLAPEEVLNQLRCAQEVRISMTSTPDPRRTSPGHPRATVIASSRLGAETIM